MRVTFLSFALILLLPVFSAANSKGYQAAISALVKGSGASEKIQDVNKVISDPNNSYSSLDLFILENAVAGIQPDEPDGGDSYSTFLTVLNKKDLVKKIQSLKPTPDSTPVSSYRSELTSILMGKAQSVAKVSRIKDSVAGLSGNIDALYFDLLATPFIVKGIELMDPEMSPPLFSISTFMLVEAQNEVGLAVKEKLKATSCATNLKRL